MDTIIGFVNDLTGEKRGPKKYYRRFNLIKVDNTILTAWVFCITTIEETNAGKILLEAAKNNLPVQLSGKITQEQGIRCITYY
jgi:hypothetical protein